MREGRSEEREEGGGGGGNSGGGNSDREEGGEVEKVEGMREYVGWSAGRRESGMREEGGGCEEVGW